MKASVTNLNFTPGKTIKGRASADEVAKIRTKDRKARVTAPSYPKIVMVNGVPNKIVNGQFVPLKKVNA